MWRSTTLSGRLEPRADPIEQKNTSAKRKTYRVALHRLDSSVEEINWPKAPQGVEIKMKTYAALT
ncbi:hypothetical protein [Candidatus Williamhamiltonella defendens]|uniref:hypothetical protein n=1 Tax=Candidatus Williamhamiltonella defendens TaxID=138072 RepID=UPI0012FF569D|nr:hypothetical protein [Candidatus Hamiltonella defensa]